MSLLSSKEHYDLGARLGKIIGSVGFFTMNKSRPTSEIITFWKKILLFFHIHKETKLPKQTWLSLNMTELVDSSLLIFFPQVVNLVDQKSMCNINKPAIGFQGTFWPLFLMGAPTIAPLGLDPILVGIVSIDLWLCVLSPPKPNNTRVPLLLTIEWYMVWNWVQHTLLWWSEIHPHAWGNFQANYQ